MGNINLEEWFSENNEIEFEKIGPGSKRKVEWKCPKGHAFVLTCGKFFKNPFCRVCKGSILVVGINDLETTRPDLFKSLIDKNFGKENTFRTSKRTFFKCSTEGCIENILASPQEFEKSVKKCRKCRGSGFSKGTIIEKAFPELLSIWNDSEAKKKLPYGAKKRVSFKCENGHIFTATSYKLIQYKDRASFCPYCLGRKVLPGFNDFETLFPEISKLWNEKNCSPSEYLPGSNKVAHWKCSKGHIFTRTITLMIRYEGSCPSCRKERSLKSTREKLKDLYEDFERYYSSENSRNLKDITISDKEELLWVCPELHIFKKTLYNFYLSQSCNICNGRVLEPGVNDLQTTHEDFSKTLKRPEKAKKVTFQTQEKLDFNCHECKKIFKGKPRRVFETGNLCEKCFQKKTTSAGELELRAFLKSILPNEEFSYNNRTIAYPYEIDIVILSLKIAFEFNGEYWHREEHIQEQHGMSSEEYHGMKRQTAFEKGYNLHYVWASDWKKNRKEVEHEIKKVLEGENSLLLSKTSIISIC